MGHNVSERKSRGVEAERAASERRLAGWRWDGKRLEPLATVEGVLARGGVVQGRCSGAECRRYVRMDLQWWARHGLGDVALNVAEQAYRCARLGCGLSWQPETYPAGVPVQFSVGTEVTLAIKCRKCGAGRAYTAEQVIAALERSETGNGNAGVNELGQHVRGKCKACGYPGWVVEVVRPAVGAGGLPIKAGQGSTERDSKRTVAVESEGETTR